MALAAVAALVAGCSLVERDSRDFRPTVARFFLETAEAGASTVVLPVSGVRVAIGDKPVFSEGDIVGVELMQVDLGRCLLFQFTPAATRDLYRFSGAHQGRRLVLMLDNVALGARRFDGPIADGRLYLFVERPDESLPDLVAALRKTATEVQRALGRKK
jgi:hypothetical protein